MKELLRINGKIEVVFKSLGQFRREYKSNISKGGMFIKTNNPHPRQAVLEISLKLPGRNEPLRLIGEVVHIVAPETAEANGWSPGMGIHFMDFESDARPVLEQYIASQTRSAERAGKENQREFQRVPSRLKIKFPSRRVLDDCYARDISRGGIFIQTDKPRQKGERFNVALVHPDTNEVLSLRGEVVRVTDQDPQDSECSPGMGVKFVELDQQKKVAIVRFLKKGNV